MIATNDLSDRDERRRADAERRALRPQEKRLEGADYFDVIDEFMEAVFERWPNVVVQAREMRFRCGWCMDSP